jgi:hypothetical protein
MIFFISDCPNTIKSTYNFIKYPENKNKEKKKRSSVNHHRDHNKPEAKSRKRDQ